MQVFISSVISGMEPYRNAAARAVRTLGHEPRMAEDYGASPDTPQRACLAGVRDADVVVLLLGARYGHPQESGLSATHEEYREAKERRPVLAFVNALNSSISVTASGTLPQVPPTYYLHPPGTGETSKRCLGGISTSLLVRLLHNPS